MSEAKAAATTPAAAAAAHEAVTTTTMSSTGSDAAGSVATTAAGAAATDLGGELKQRRAVDGAAGLVSDDASAKQAAEKDAKQAADLDAKKVDLRAATVPASMGGLSGIKKQGKEAKKQQWQLPLPTSRLGIAASVATCLLCGVGVALHLYAGPRSRFHLPAAEPIPISGLPEAAEPMPGSDLVENQESLEDALKSLEGAEPVAASPVDIEGDFFHGLEDHIDVREAHQPKDAAQRKPAKKPKRTVVAPSADEVEAPSVPSEVDAEDALKKLEGGEDKKDLLNDLVQKLTSSDSKVADEVVEKASKKSKKAKESKLSDEEKEKAKTVLQEALQKLHSDDADHSELREKLQTLLGNDGDDSDASESKSQGNKKKTKAQKEAEADDGSHGEFVKLLSGEQERKHAHSLADVKKEFKEDFAADTKYLLCAGCKLVAARLTSELSTHDVHESESPAQMIAAKRRAIDATCSSFRHLQVAPGAHGLRIQAGDAQPDTPGKPDAPSRLCHALLEESKFDILTKLIQAKIPEHSYLSGVSANKGQNWERWLCAQRTRVCKRNEVRDDDEEQEL